MASISADCKRNDITMNKKKIFTYIILFFLFYSNQLFAEKINILDANFFFDEKYLLMDTKAHFVLHEDIIKALDGNISIPFSLEVKLSKERFFFLKVKTHYKSFRFSLAKYALGDQYIVTDKQNGIKVSFPTLDRAQKHLENRQADIIAEKKSIEIGKPHEIAVRWRLIKSELPIPMLLPVLFTSEWNLNSGWKSFQI